MPAARSLKRGASSTNGECPHPSNHDCRACGMAAARHVGRGRQHDGHPSRPWRDQGRHLHPPKRVDRLRGIGRPAGDRPPHRGWHAHVVGERPAELRFGRLLAEAPVDEGDRCVDLGRERLALRRRLGRPWSATAGVLDHLRGDEVEAGEARVAMHHQILPDDPAAHRPADQHRTLAAAWPLSRRQDRRPRRGRRDRRQDRMAARRRHVP